MKQDICKQDIGGVSLVKLAPEILSEIKKLPQERIIDLLNALYELKIEDNGGIRVLLKCSSLLTGFDSLSRAAKVQDNYVREIIYNRPHFDMQTKVNCILNASKTSCNTHIIKYGNLFINTEKNGNISLKANESRGESRALGLFTGDMQFINEYDLKLIDIRDKILPHTINCSENHGFWSYENITYGNNTTLKRSRIIDGAFFEKFEIANLDAEPVKAILSISSLIKDIFEVRGKININHNSPVVETDCDGNILINTSFDSGNTYGVKISFLSKNKLISPVEINEELGRITFEVELFPGSTKNINLKIQPLLNYKPYIDGAIVVDSPNSYDEAFNIAQNTKKTEFATIKLTSDIPNIQNTIDQCIKDLSLLTSYINVDDKLYSYIGAGLPRYSALFGRDSIITALEVFLLNQDIARDTLELLAIFQGKTFEDKYKNEIKDIKSSNWSESAKTTAIKGIKNYYIQREEAPGKILHELRVGELANSGIIPHKPYYGAVDSTPLWLILYYEYYKWAQDKDFLLKLLPNAEAALEWIEANLVDGYLRFNNCSYSRVRIQNQCWKDAGDSIKHLVNDRGNLCDPEYPVALAEVQGYVYKALISMSKIYKDLGETFKSEKLLNQAIELKSRFNKDFWIEKDLFFAMALDKKNKPVSSIASNTGHCLTMGIVDEDKVRLVEEKLISDELYTGWGIRTLSNKSEAYDPLSYHNGSVWMHDSAFTAIGLSKKSMAVIAKSLFEVANNFENNRLPELFAGFQRKDNDNFVQYYPEACAPQSWASGSLIWILLNLVGLKTKNKDVVFENTYIPDWLKSFSIEKLKIGDRLNISVQLSK